MGSADGGQKEPGGTQVAEVQHGLDTFQEDGGEQQPDESQLGLPDGRQMPERLSIRMPSNFGNEYASFEFQKIENNEEIMYVCKRGSNWARTDERMLLTFTVGSWKVYDSAVLADKITIHCRQTVFRCDEGNITEPGWHMWHWNVRADETKKKNNGYDAEEWSCQHVWAETTVP